MVQRKNILFGLLILGIAGTGVWVSSYFFKTSLPSKAHPMLLSIGIVDINRIKIDSKVFQKFKEILDGLNDKIHQEILEKEVKLRNEYERFKKREEEAKGVNSELLKQKAELDKKHAELEKMARTRHEALINEYTRGLLKIKQTLEEIMDDLGRTHGLKLILNKSLGEGNKMDQSIVLFFSEGLDLTGDVIQKLDTHPSLKNIRKDIENW